MHQINFYTVQQQPSSLAHFPQTENSLSPLREILFTHERKCHARCPRMILVCHARAANVNETPPPPQAPPTFRPA